MKNFLFCIFSLTMVISCHKGISGSSDLSDAAWQRLKTIEKTIVPPTFKNVDYNVKDYGAVANGVSNCTEAFKKAIIECSSKGGGRVIVPAGIYFTGPIHLENNVNFHLEDGAEIRFSTNTDDFYPLVQTSFEGNQLMNYSPLIYAKDKKNIAVTGNGILNGQASEKNWWTWKGSETYGFKKGMPMQNDPNNLPVLIQMAENNTPIADRIFGNGRYLRPNFIETFDCQNVLIQGVKIINSPFWELHPMKSTNVIIDGVTINSHGPNNDGCDPEYSKNVLIKNCTFNTGDDCIAIKSGRDKEGRTVGIPSENIIVRNCKMIDGHGGVTIGSETSAGVKNVFVEDCVMDSPELDRAIRLKTNTRRGGVVDGVYVRNLTVGKVKEAVLHITMNYEIYSNQKGNFLPEIRNIMLENVTVKDGGKYAIYADGIENSKIQNITFKNVKIDKVKEDFYLKNVENLKLINTYINGTKANYNKN